MGAVAEAEAPPLIAKEIFRTWLQTKGEFETVGISRSPCKCPIAQFIGGDKTHVTATLYRVNVNERHHPLPDWAITFVRRIDSDCAALQAVTATKALEILDQI